MVREVVHWLRCDRGGVFLDGTLGTGGHTLAIFTHSPQTTRVIGLDRDPEALAVARRRLEPFSDRLSLVHGTFAEIKKILPNLGVPKVDGILLDLGLSTLQLESPGRGFSFRREEPLDLRMDRSRGVPAGAWLEQASEKELARVLKEYGEEKKARLLARRIKSYRPQGSFWTTTELADLIARILPRSGRIHPATRTFQALRIAVNEELKQLAAFLEDFLEVLTEGGRICVIAYHSLEDRMVKQTFLRLERGIGDVLGLQDPQRPQGQPVFKRVVTKAIIPSDEEVRKNPRSRGAKMRVGERG